MRHKKLTIGLLAGGLISSVAVPIIMLSSCSCESTIDNNKINIDNTKLDDIHKIITSTLSSLNTDKNNEISKTKTNLLNSLNNILNNEIIDIQMSFENDNNQQRKQVNIEIIFKKELIISENNVDFVVSPDNQHKLILQNPITTNILIDLHISDDSLNQIYNLLLNEMTNWTSEIKFSTSQKEQQTLAKINEISSLANKIFNISINLNYTNIETNSQIFGTKQQGFADINIVFNETISINQNTNFFDNSINVPNSIKTIIPIRTNIIRFNYSYNDENTLNQLFYDTVKSIGKVSWDYSSKQGWLTKMNSYFAFQQNPLTNLTYKCQLNNGSTSLKDFLIVFKYDVNFVNSSYFSIYENNIIKIKNSWSQYGFFTSVDYREIPTFPL